MRTLLAAMVLLAMMWDSQATVLEWDDTVPADLNGDGVVNVLDLGLFKQLFLGDEPAGWVERDFDFCPGVIWGDGCITDRDLPFDIISPTWGRGDSDYFNEWFIIRLPTQHQADVRGVTVEVYNPNTGAHSLTLRTVLEETRVIRDADGNIIGVEPYGFRCSGSPNCSWDSNWCGGRGGPPTEEDPHPGEWNYRIILDMIDGDFYASPMTRMAVWCR